MPIIKSAAKRMRQNTKRAQINARYKRQMRESIKQLNNEITGNKPKDAAETLKTAQKAIDKASKKGIIHPNTAARRKSQLMKRYEAAFGSAAKSPAKKAATKPAAKTGTKKPTTKATGKAKPAKSTAKTTRKTTSKPATKTTRKSSTK